MNITKSPEQLERELGLLDAIAFFVSECEEELKSSCPEIEYNKDELQRFVVSQWSSHSTPFEMSCDFVNNLCSVGEAE